jgi:hypothetical protein
MTSHFRFDFFDSTLTGHGLQLLWQVNGLRYTLDFMPMLFVFTVLGLEGTGRAGPARLGKFLIAYSIGLNFIAMALIPAAGRLLGALAQ